MTTEKEQQPYSSFRGINIPPNGDARIRLSGGVRIPFIYSMGVNSSVPYIQLIGSSAGQKLFSWNEQIVVPPGEFVTIRNASFHPGDIFIQSGYDPAAKAGRVTIPFAPTLVNNPFVAGPQLITSPFRLDTRRARRAFVCGIGETPAAGATFNIVGRGVDRSYPLNTAFSIDGPDAAAQYRNTIPIAPASLPGLVPLGENADFGDGVHALLDTAQMYYSDLGADNLSGAFTYVLEYL